MHLIDRVFINNPGITCAVANFSGGAELKVQGDIDIVCHITFLMRWALQHKSRQLGATIIRLDEKLQRLEDGDLPVTMWLTPRAQHRVAGGKTLTNDEKIVERRKMRAAKVLRIQQKKARIVSMRNALLERLKWSFGAKIPDVHDKVLRSAVVDARDVEEMIRKHQETPNRAAVNAWTPLHIATFSNNEAAVRALLKNPNTRVDNKDACGYTALHYACAHNAKEIALLLVEAGADFTLKNRECNTAIDVASILDHCELEEALQAAIPIGAEARLLAARFYRQLFAGSPNYYPLPPNVVDDEMSDSFLRNRMIAYVLLHRPRFSKMLNKAHSRDVFEDPLYFCGQAFGTTSMKKVSEKYLPLVQAWDYRHFVRTANDRDRLLAGTGDDADIDEASMPPNNNGRVLPQHGANVRGNDKKKKKNRKKTTATMTAATTTTTKKKARKVTCRVACGRKHLTGSAHGLDSCLDDVAATLFQGGAGCLSGDHVGKRLDTGSRAYDQWLVDHADEVQEERERRKKLSVEALEAQRRWDAWEQKSAEEERRRRRQAEELAKRGPEIDENAGISFLAHNSAAAGDGTTAAGGDDKDQDESSEPRIFAGPLVYSIEDGSPALYDIVLDAEPRGSVLVKFSVAALLEEANAASRAPLFRITLSSPSIQFSPLSSIAYCI